jgi:hypothetical protein
LAKNFIHTAAQTTKTRPKRTLSMPPRLLLIRRHRITTWITIIRGILFFCTNAANQTCRAIEGRGRVGG